MKKKKIQNIEAENKHLKETLESLTTKWTKELNENEKLMLSTLNENQTYKDKIIFLEEEIKKLKDTMNYLEAGKTFLPSKEIDEFKSDSFDSRKRKPTSQDIYKFSDPHIVSEISSGYSQILETSSDLSRCIFEKDELMIELQKCKEKLQQYETLYKDANYISSTCSQEVNALTNLKSLFISFFTYHFQKRFLSKKIPQDENFETLFRLKDLLEELEKSNKNNYCSVLNTYILKEISTLTEIKWPTNLESITSIDKLLQAAMDNVKKYIKNHPSDTALKKLFKMRLNAFEFGNEDIIDTMQKMLSTLQSICNSNLVTNMVQFLNDLEVASSKRYEQLSDDENKICKSSYIVRLVLP